MTSKLSLLGGIAAGALLIAAGAANAEADLSRDSGAYLLALEADVDPATALSTNLVLDLSGSNSIPSGNVLLTLTLANGTFNSPVTAGALTATPAEPACTFSSTVSTGGGVGSNAVTFLLSGAASGECSIFNINNLDVLPGATGSVTVQSNLRTDFGTPIDDQYATATILERAQAFSVVFDGAFAETADLDTVGSPYLDFANPGAQQLGEIVIEADTNYNSDLIGTPVSLADVEGVEVDIMGSFQGFDAGVTLAGGSPDAAPTGGMATWTFANADDLDNSDGDDGQFVLTPDGISAIRTSSYSATVSIDLDDALYNDPSTFSGALGDIDREGANVVLPGMQSLYLVQRLGENNQVRVGNHSDEPAAVFATILSRTSVGSNVPAWSGTTTGQVGTVPAGGEFIVNTSRLTNTLGEFGRGDIELTIEGQPEDVTVRRFQRDATGQWVEVTSGTVAEDQD